MMNAQKYIFIFTIFFLLLISAVIAGCDPPGLNLCLNDDGCSPDYKYCGSGNTIYLCDYACFGTCYRTAKSGAFIEDCDDRGDVCLGNFLYLRDYSCEGGYCLLVNQELIEYCPDTYYCNGGFMPPCQRYHKVCNGDECVWGDYAIDDTCDSSCEYGCCDGSCCPDPCEGVKCPTICEYCSSLDGKCYPICAGTDTDCGCTICSNCNINDGCSNGYDKDWGCGATFCEVKSSTCTEACCDAYHGDSAAYCSGGVCIVDPCEGVTCPACQYCDEGSCVNQTNGYNDCGAGCQRCVNGVCADYNAACSGSCSGGYFVNFDCVNDSCAGSTCTETCCDAYHGNTAAYCQGGVCYAPNQSPSALISCQIEWCDGPGCQCNATWVTYNGDGVIYHIINNSTDPDNNIIKSTWSIIGWQDPWFSCDGICNLTMPRISAGDYTIKLEIEDEGGLTDSTSHPITVKQDVVAGFECSLDNTTWFPCDDPNLRPTQGELVYFRDDLPDPNENSSPADGATAIVSRVWEESGTVFDFGNNSNASTTLTEVPTTIILTVRDDTPGGGRADSQSHTIEIELPLPEYKEVSPIIWLKKIFAGIINFFNGFLSF